MPIVKTVYSKAALDLQKIMETNPGLIIAFYGPDSDANGIFSTLNDSKIPFIACSDTGRFLGDSYHLEEDSFVALGFPKEIFDSIDIIHYDLSPEKNYGEIKKDVKEKYLSSLKNSGIDRNSPDMEREFVINLLYGLASANPVLEAQSEISLFLQTVGGSSGGKLDFIHSEVMTNGMKGKIGASAIIRLKKDYKMVIDRISSFEQVKGSLKVTALENPRHIRELNGKPALDEYLSSVGETKDNLSASLFARYTLGIEPGDGEKLITSIMKDDGKGGLLTYNDLVEGTELNIYSAKSQEADRKSQLQSLKSLEPIIYISFDCVLCYLARNAMDEKEKIAKLYSENLPNTGVMGFGTFSENICGANVNQTETFLAIYKA